MRVGIYARVSTDAQEARGTIGSQLEALRARVAAEGDELVDAYIDDGVSGARLDRPGLDALRDAAEAGLIEALWCLTPDRLSRGVEEGRSRGRVEVTGEGKASGMGEDDEEGWEEGGEAEGWAPRDAVSGSTVYGRSTHGEIARVGTTT